MLREIDDLDVARSAALISQDESVVCEPHKRGFRAFECSAGIDLQMNAARAILESTFAVGDTPQSLKNPSVEWVRGREQFVLEERWFQVTRSHGHATDLTDGRALRGYSLGMQ